MKNISHVWCLLKYRSNTYYLFIKTRLHKGEQILKNSTTVTRNYSNNVNRFMIFFYVNASFHVRFNRLCKFKSLFINALVITVILLFRFIYVRWRHFNGPILDLVVEYLTGNHHYSMRQTFTLYLEFEQFYPPNC